MIVHPTIQTAEKRLACEYCDLKYNIIISVALPVEKACSSLRLILGVGE